MRGKDTRVSRPRHGHILAIFGLFLSLAMVLLQSVNAPKIIAFGTSEIDTLSNQYRTNAGLEILATNGKLTESAQAKADNMAQNLYFAHIAPDGKDPWYFFEQADYAYLSAGENLALTNQVASSVADGWFNSPGHKANLLSSAYTEVGYGISYVPTFTYNDVTYSNVYLVAAHYGQPVASSAVGATSTQPVSKILGTEQQSTTASGTMAVASQDQPKLPQNIALMGLALGALLVLIGIAIEVRRFIRHKPLLALPH